MRRILLVIAAALSFLVGVSADVAFNRVAEAIVNAIPVDDAPCYYYTPRVCGVDAGGRPFGVGGERLKFKSCP